MNYHAVIPSQLLMMTIIIAFLITGCGNDIHRVNAITTSATGPLMSAKNIVAVFSDSGKVEAKLKSVLLNRYSGQNAYLEFPKGFKIEIYDSASRVETTISGNYGKRFENTRIMEARGNVIVRNEIKNQQLNTEYLKWDENRKLITSNLPVKIITSDKVLYGEGLEANESFSWYRFNKVSGQMMVKKDSI